MGAGPADDADRSEEESRAKYGLPASIYDHHHWQIHQRVASDPDFRSLCEEHEAALGALEHFRASGASSRRIAEYIVLVDELTQEILRELKS